MKKHQLVVMGLIVLGTVGSTINFVKAEQVSNLNYKSTNAHTLFNVQIPDINLKNVILNQLGLPEGSEVTNEQMASLTDLDAMYKGIQSIEGLQYAVNLKVLALRGNSIEDITPLRTLTQLDTLTLKENKISNLSALSGLNLLTLLDIGNNPLKNDQTSFLKNLVNIEQFSSSYTQINDLNFLRNFNKLSKLVAFDSGLVDITPLESCTLLTDIRVPQNNIQDISVLKDLKSVSIAHFEENEIEKLPEYFSKSLVYLNLNKNNLLNIKSLSTATNLQIAELNENRIEDISVISSLSNLRQWEVLNQKIVLPVVPLNIPIKLDIKDENNQTPNLLFNTPGIYSGDNVYWNSPGNNSLSFSSESGNFTGTVEQFVVVS